MSGALDREPGPAKGQDILRKRQLQAGEQPIKDVHPHGWLTMAEVIKYSSKSGPPRLPSISGAKNIPATFTASASDRSRAFRSRENSRGSYAAEKMAANRPGHNRLRTEHRRNHPSDHKRHCSDSQRRAIRPADNRSDILDCQGKSIEEFHSIKTRKVIQKRTADQIRAMMMLVTQEGGTGVNAAPEGYTVAGKTGTAQVMDP